MSTIDHSLIPSSKFSSRTSLLLSKRQPSKLGTERPGSSFGAIGSAIPVDHGHSFQASLRNRECVLTHTSDNLKFRFSGVHRSINKPANEEEKLSKKSGPCNPLCEGLVRKNKKEKKHFSDLVTEFQDELVLTEDKVSHITSEELKRLVNSGKSAALALQLMMDQCSSLCTQRIIKLISEDLEFYLTHSSGSYLLQKILDNSETGFKEMLSNKINRDFTRFASNEYASRVMQKLLETFNPFLKNSLHKFASNVEVYTKDFSSVFLVSAALQAAKTQSSKDFVLEALSQDPENYLHNKYFKRVLISYILTCSEASLSKCFGIFTAFIGIDSIFDDKYRSLIFKAFLDRCLPAAQQLLLHSIFHHLVTLIDQKYFGYFVSQLLRRVSNLDMMNQLYNNIRQQESRDYFEEVMTSSSRYKKYSAIVLQLREYLHGGYCKTPEETRED